MSLVGTIGSTRENAVAYLDDKWDLGHWLGPSMDIGPALCAKVLKSNGQQEHRSSYRHLTEDEINSPNEKEKRQLFDRLDEQKLGEAAQSTDFGEGYETPTYEPYTDDDGDGIGHTTDADDEPTPLTFDNYLGAEVVLSKGDDMVAGKVVGRKRDSDGKPVGRENKNPMLDTRVYEVEFVDGGHAEFGANVIAENMYAQCNVDGNQFQLMDCIVDHRKDHTAIQAGIQYFIMRGHKQQKRTTRGWYPCVKWKDKSTSWERLSDLKESYPVEVAEYAAAFDLQEEQPSPGGPHKYFGKGPESLWRSTKGTTSAHTNSGYGS